MTQKFRLIIDAARPAAFNMAADEYLMELQKEVSAEAVLRFYGWSESSISIGYFQSVAEVARRFDAEKKKIKVIRRLSGGGLVIHGEDLTFSLAMKNPNSFLPQDPRESYLAIHEILRRSLGPFYPELDYAKCDEVPSPRGKASRVCFEEPTCHDLLIKKKKVVGASQRRKDGMLLHQSAVFLAGDRNRDIAAVVKQFESEWKINFENRAWSAEEIKAIEGKAAERYSSAEWIYSPPSS